MATNPFTTDELINTNGIKANRHRAFSVSLTGDRWYKLLRLLEGYAERSDSYPEISDLVLWVTEIRTQLRQQKF